jgi:hypothetical protein
MSVPVPRSTGWPPHISIERLTIALGIALVAAAIAANQAWLDRHFLPSFFVTRSWYVRAETTARVTIAAAGVLLLLVARGVGRSLARSPWGAASIAVAALLAVGAGELILRRTSPRPLGWLVADDEPRRQVNPRLGWVLTPHRVGRTTIAGHTIEYAIDSNGYRVRRLEEPVDRRRPTILFVGESVMFGEGLPWEESVPAQVGGMLHVQSANLAVHGYSTDQAYLRLVQEMPEFAEPVAVVSLFMTALLGRNLDDDRPHLGPGLMWLPAAQPSRLASLVGLLVPFRRDRTVEDGIRMTHDVLRTTVALARARGANPLIVVPQIGAESPSEQTLRHRVLDGGDLPCAFVEIDAAWHLPWDRHPDARGAHAIAQAIADRLRNR